MSTNRTLTDTTEIAQDVSTAGQVKLNISGVASSKISDATTAGKAMLTAANVAAQTALLNAVAGDTGTGGTKGLVPAPSSGDAAAGKFLKADGTFAVPSGAVAASGSGLLALTRQAVTASSSTLNIDMSLGWKINLTVNASITSFSFTNWPSSGIAGKADINITNSGSYSWSGWPGSTCLSSGGTKPTLTASGKDRWVFTSDDGGTNFNVFAAGTALA